MPQLFVPLTGVFQKLTGSGFNTFGENLELPQWVGAEIGLCDTFQDVWGAVSESEYHDWIIGVHHPLYNQGGPKWPRFLDPDETVRHEALEVAATAAQAARHVGARYILFHYPWPGLQMTGRDHRTEGWYFTHPLSPLEVWDERSFREWSRVVFDRLATVQEKEAIRIVLEIDGPNPFAYEGDALTDLFTEFPSLSLCVDTGRLGLLARTHGQDPLALARRWLPWARHMHLSTSMWDDQGKFTNHIPTDGTHRADRWPSVTPAADIAELIVAAQPRCTVVLEHNPRAVTPEKLEECHRWVAELVGE